MRRPARLVKIPRGSHRRLSASGCYRWSVCHRSPDFEKKFPESTSEFAAEGTVAHWVGEQCLILCKDATNYIGTTVEADGFTFVVDEEMAQYVQIYVDHCRSLMEPAITSGIETTFELDKYHRDTGGTGDFWSFDGQILEIMDFKYGRGVPVDAKDNKQLMIYALGAVENLLDRHSPKNKTVRIWVIQPRAQHPDGPIRSATYTWEEILFWGKTFLKEHANLCDDPSQPFVPGTHCRFCRAAGSCRTLKEHNKALAKADFGATLHLPDPNQLSAEEIDALLLVSTDVRDWMASVEKTAQALVERGTLVLPHHKLVKRTGTKRRWKDTDAAAEVLEEHLGEDAYKKTLLTVKQAETKSGKDLSEYWEKPDGGYLLVTRDDKREEVISDTELDFLDTHELLQ